MESQDFESSALATEWPQFLSLQLNYYSGVNWDKAIYKDVTLARSHNTDDVSLLDIL